MAGQAAKKAAKASASAANQYFRVIALVHGLFICNVLRKFREFGSWQCLELLSTSLVYYVCYHGIVEAAGMGIPAGPYFDVMVVCLAAQTLGIFSKHGWYIYLLIPAYYTSLLAYWISNKVGAWSASQQLEASDADTARELKRQAKKERKAARGPKMRVR